MAREAFYLEGVAVDGAKERVYLLVVTTREGDHEEILEKISEDEEKLEPKGNPWNTSGKKANRRNRWKKK